MTTIELYTFYVCYYVYVVLSLYLIKPLAAILQESVLYIANLWIQSNPIESECSQLTTDRIHEYLVLNISQTMCQ